ncbi:MAG: HIT domain-containing protein [Gemmatimonadales bacterium]|nr:HIT domain-containing protein [Gemmatimonadales bacterium]
MADCIFCKIASREIQANEVARTDDAVAFRDTDPKAPTHILIIPTRHVAAVRDPSGEAGEQLLGHLLAFAATTATALGLDEGGYRIVTNTGNDAGQSVPHLHFHLLGGRRLGWPPG